MCRRSATLLQRTGANVPDIMPNNCAGMKSNKEIHQRKKTDHAALSFYLHWHCPLATHPGWVTSLSQTAYMWIISIFDGCATERKPQEGLLSGPSRGHVDSHYSYWAGYPSSFTHITSIRPICVSHLKGFNSISFILWKRVGDGEGREKWVFTCRWGQKIYFFFPTWRLICRDVRARLPFEITFNWSPLYSTLVLFFTLKQKLSMPQK